MPDTTSTQICSCDHSVPIWPTLIEHLLSSPVRCRVSGAWPKSGCGQCTWQGCQQDPIPQCGGRSRPQEGLLSGPPSHLLPPTGQSVLRLTNTEPTGFAVLFPSLTAGADPNSASWSGLLSRPMLTCELGAHHGQFCLSGIFYTVSHPQ